MRSSSAAASAARCRPAGSPRRARKVVVLERGRRWDRSNYPRGLDDDWVWDHARPRRAQRLARPAHLPPHGGGAGRGRRRRLVDLREHLGGARRAKPSISAGRRKSDWDALAPHYATVGRVMNVQCRARRAMAEPHEADEGGRGRDRRGRPVPQARARGLVRSGLALRPADAVDARHSRRFVNAQGVEQGTCVHLANCDIGCDVDAKNTLDRNYLAHRRDDTAPTSARIIWRR